MILGKKARECLYSSLLLALRILIVLGKYDRQLLNVVNILENKNGMLSIIFCCSFVLVPECIFEQFNRLNFIWEVFLNTLLEDYT